MHHVLTSRCFRGRVSLMVEAADFPKITLKSQCTEVPSSEPQNKLHSTFAAFPLDLAITNTPTESPVPLTKYGKNELDFVVLQSASSFSVCVTVGASLRCPNYRRYKNALVGLSSRRKWLGLFPLVFVFAGDMSLINSN